MQLFKLPLTLFLILEIENDLNLRNLISVFNLLFVIFPDGK